jgi:hypothetical protein
VAQGGRAGQAIGNNMDFACWITKGTNTHSEYEILISTLYEHCLFYCNRDGVFTARYELNNYITEVNLSV